MKLQIFHTVNAGLYLWNGKSGILVDALHDGTAHGFSATPEQYIHMMERRESFFSQYNDLLFTHGHPDHFDKGLTEKFLSLNPNSLIYGPGIQESNAEKISIEYNVDLITMKDYQIYSFLTVHDGKMFADYPHRSYLIQSEADRIWISGDAIFDQELAKKVRRICGAGEICGAFVNVYQIENMKGIHFLETLKPQNIYLYHLPFEEDDIYHYHRMAKTVIKRRNHAGYGIKVLEREHFV